MLGGEFGIAKKKSDDDIRERLSASDPVDIIHPLSPAVLNLLKEASEMSNPPQDSLSHGVLKLLEASEVICKPLLSDSMMVLKCAPNLVVKVTRFVDDDTEYTTLRYFERHKPTISAPRHLGHTRMNNVHLIFQTYMPSTTPAAVWSQLNSSQKASIRDQLNTIMLDLRSIPFPDGSALGGVAVEGSQDIRRHLRQSEKPILTFSDYEDFLFLCARPGGQVFGDFLRQLYPQQSEGTKIVFTHGDLRPDNITVDMNNDNQWVITGLLDWEYSGFYPEIH